MAGDGFVGDGPSDDGQERASAELARVRAELDQVRAELAKLAHDLNGALAVIQGGAGLLRQDGEGSEELDAIEEATTNAVAHVRRIAELGRGEG